MIQLQLLFTVSLIIFGLIIGSFLTACIYRIPAAKGLRDEEGVPAERLENISIAEPKRSFCTSCGAQLKWYHNLPVLSWLIQGGRCAYCKSKISVLYPAVELMTALAAVASVHHFGYTLTSLVVFAFLSALIVISFIDIEFYIIPNVISLPGTAIAIAIAVINQFTGIFGPPIVSGVVDSFLGILAGAGFLYVIAEFYLKVRKIEGLGMGDVKLLALTGALFGPACAFYTIFVGSIVGAVLGVAAILILNRDKQKHLPFGPYLAFGTVAYLFTGNQLVELWIRFIHQLFGLAY